MVEKDSTGSFARSSIHRICAKLFATCLATYICTVNEWRKDHRCRKHPEHEHGCCHNFESFDQILRDISRDERQIVNRDECALFIQQSSIIRIYRRPRLDILSIATEGAHARVIATFDRE
jgi:hypothetical protein